jgi:hypothetical protein
LLLVGGLHAFRLSSYLAGIKKIEQAMDVAFDAEFALVPCFEGYPGFEIFYLEPIFDIDGKQNVFICDH